MEFWQLVKLLPRRQEHQLIKQHSLAAMHWLAAESSACQIYKCMHLSTTYGSMLAVCV